MTIVKNRLGKRRALGLAIVALGAIVLLAPLWAGEWIISLLGVALVIAGLIQFVQIVRSREGTASYLPYAAGVLSILLGLVVFASPDMALAGLLSIVSLLLFVDGAIKLHGSFAKSGVDRVWALVNGLVSILLGVLSWYLLTARIGLISMSIVLASRLLVEGWSMMFAISHIPEGGSEPIDIRRHPDWRLKLEPSEYIGEMQQTLLATDPVRTTPNIVWCCTFLGIFFLIHVLRTDAKWSFIGFISPFSAVIGDAVVALLLAIVLILPLRMLWRRLSRSIEVGAWRRYERLKQDGESLSPAEKLLTVWLEFRMRSAFEMIQFRRSLNFAFWRLLRAGLPLTAILIAVNSIWGFSWYFNSENWASGVWQAITKARVDVWRQRAAEDVERSVMANGVPPEKVFAIDPDGVGDADDLSFIVIGDTGEGDPSQMSLRDQLIAAGKRDEVKFLVLSSDVIYPDGKMKDYETNFYLPFKGFEKPIYAIPGNHDWYDADEGFNANFLDRDAALISLRSRVAVDLKTNAVTPNDRFEEEIAEAKRLREYYRVRNGLQRAPYFEMHRPGFSLIAVDTGIMRTVDEREKAWLISALTRAGDNFKMVVLGHPFYVAGKYTAAGDVGFDEIHNLLKQYKVDIAMAGDTHDFEFYRERYDADGQPAEMLNFVNGGGGAYLSVGTSVGFPDQIDVADYAFYPRTDEVTAKLKRETPIWRMPFFYWMQWFHGYPFDSEMVSGAFDFNRSPFFQSFVQVDVQRSLNRVRLSLYGVNGQLRWRDLQVGGQVKPPGVSDDEFVAFTAPLSKAAR